MMYVSYVNVIPSLELMPQPIPYVTLCCYRDAATAIIGDVSCLCVVSSTASYIFQARSQPHFFSGGGVTMDFFGGGKHIWGSCLRAYACRNVIDVKMVFVRFWLGPAPPVAT